MELEIKLISENSSMLREWRNLFKGFPNIKIIKDKMLKNLNTPLVIEIDSNGTMDRKYFKIFQNISFSNFKNSYFLHIDEVSIKNKNLYNKFIIVQTSVQKNGTYISSSYLSMLGLLVFLNKNKYSTIYIPPLGLLNNTSYNNIAKDMASAYTVFSSLDKTTLVGIHKILENLNNRP